ncbi:hypothetical protein ACLOJK_015176 [Asimina triloba]
MASSKHPSSATEEPDAKRPKFAAAAPNSELPNANPRHVELNPADSDLDFDIEGSGLRGHALHEEGFAYCWSGSRANVGIAGGKYCFGCKIISEQPVVMEDTPTDQQHLCRVGLSRGDDNVGSLGESEHSFGYGGTGKISNSRKFLDYGTKFGVGDTIICAVNLENKPFAVVGFSKNGQWLGTAKEFDAGPTGLKVVNSPVAKLPWESALFPHVLLKNVVVQMQFCIEDGLVPEDGFRPWSSALEDGNAVMGPTFLNPKDCTVLMMVGLPASGKTTWAEKWVKEHPEKRYVLLGTNLALDQMKVPGLARKQNYGERFDRLMDRATGIFNTLLTRAAKTPRNYILDQTNVYKSARKRKLKAFVNYQKIAVVIFPQPDELKNRAQKRFKEMGKEVPAEAVNEIIPLLSFSANYVLPVSKDMPRADELFDQTFPLYCTDSCILKVMFPELNRAESQRYLNEMKLALGSSKSNANNSAYSHKISGQSFTSPLPPNGGAGAHWRNPHPSFTPPDYGFHTPQKAPPSYSAASSHGRPEIPSGGYRPASGSSNLPVSRGGSHGNYSHYGNSLHSHEPDHYGTSSMSNPYGRQIFESRSPIPSGGSDVYHGLGGGNPYSRPNFQSQYSFPIGATDLYWSSGNNDRFRAPNLERQSSFGGPNMENPGNAYSYGNSGGGELKVPQTEAQPQLGGLFMPHQFGGLFTPHVPSTASNGSPYGAAPSRPPSGHFPSADRCHSPGYPHPRHY